MNLWTLEIARLIRTFRGLALVTVYLLFAVLGPITARYMSEIFERFATEGMTVTFGEPTPLDGLVQFLSNTSQIGLLAVIIVAAAALTVYARPEHAAFLRTRISKPRDLILPRYVVVTAAASIALIIGTVVTAALTAALIGSLPLTAVTIGTVYGILYLAFAVSVVAATAGFSRSQLTTVFVTVAVLLVLPALAVVDVLAPWLPSELLTAVAGLVAGDDATDYLRAVAVTIVVIPGLLWLAVHRAATREL